MRDSSNTCPCLCPCPCPCPLSCFSRLAASRNAPHCCHVASLPTPASVALEKRLLVEKVEMEKKKSPEDGESRSRLKSILKKPIGSGFGSDGAEKGRVRWRDAEGKELVEIREFDAELREPVTDNYIIPICGCVIL